MKQEEITKIVENQRIWYFDGNTLPVKNRIAVLKKLRKALLDREADIVRALCTDLGKSAEESYMCETGMVISEISYLLRHIRSYAKEKTVLTPLAQFASRSYKKPTPYGVTLIMSP